MSFRIVTLFLFFIVGLGDAEARPETNESFLGPAEEVLKLTSYTTLKENLVSLSPQEAAAIETLKVQLQTEAELLSQDLTAHDFEAEAYALWVRAPSAPVIYMPTSASHDSLLCLPETVCTPDDYFFRKSIQAREARALFEAFATLKSPLEGTAVSSNPQAGSARGLASLSSTFEGGGGSAKPLSPQPGNTYVVQGGNYLLCPQNAQGGVSQGASCTLVGPVSKYYVVGEGSAPAQGRQIYDEKAQALGLEGSYQDQPYDPFSGEAAGAAHARSQDTSQDTFEDESLVWSTNPDSQARSAHPSSTSGSSYGSSRGGTSSYSSAMTQAFQRCEERHQRAQSLCGSSYQGPNSQAVQNELNLAAGMQLANYLQYARASTKLQGKSMYEVCDASEKMARSMTALNAAYTGICTAAQNACASSCQQAAGYMRRLDISDEDFTYALSTTSENFDPERLHRACKTDMNHQMTQGIFQTAQTAQMMQAASSCKTKLASDGACAMPELWNSQACYDYCQESGNNHHPACSRFTAMTSHCSNPAFAEKNTFCLCVNNPGDPSCRGGGSFPSDETARGGDGQYIGRGGHGSQGLISGGGGTFGQGYAGGAAGAGSSSQSSMGSGAGGAGGPMMGSSGGGGAAAETPGGGGALASGYKTGIIDGVQSFGGGARRAAPGGKHVIYGDMDSDNPYRRIAIESDDPNFDLKQYLPPEDFEANRAPRCYYGKDRIGCMHGPSLFDMVSRQYRKIRHEMME